MALSTIFPILLQTVCLTRNTNPLPSLDMCLVPVEIILAAPTFHDTQGRGKCSQERFECYDENGPSDVMLKPRARASRSATATDLYAYYVFNAAKIRSLISSQQSAVENH